MHALRIHSLSLGCPKTRVDTERLLAGLGTFTPVDDPAEADLIFVNTCGFIAPAVEESVASLLDLAGRIEEVSPRPLLAAAGCLVSRYPRELSPELPEVDLWLPLARMADWPRLICEALGREAPAAGPAGRVLSTPPGTAYLKVAEGCRHACAFCTIPSIRGPLRSRPLPELLAEARELLSGGVHELVLVAQDLTDWGADLGVKGGLAPLVEALAGLDGLKWLRLMYLYPAGLTEETLRVLSGLGAPLLPYFDVPLQHADPDILKSMGRPFAADPRRVVERIRTFFPEAALRTSLIVGYPGETSARFRTLMDFVAEVRFDHLGVFAFCPEEGTPAAGLPEQVPEKIKAARRDELMSLQASVSEGLLAGCLGRRLDILVDAPEPDWPGLFIGRTWFQAPEVDGVTYVSGQGAAPGMMVEAEVVETKTYDLVALI